MLVIWINFQIKHEIKDGGGEIRRGEVYEGPGKSQGNSGIDTGM